MSVNYIQDLCQYKYEVMVVKSLDIQNKLYSSQMDMFTLAKKAQVTWYFLQFYSFILLDTSIIVCFQKEMKICFFFIIR